jgi:hypothetical protein
MGDRAQIKFIDDEKKEIWFYSHWDGEDIEKAVVSAMTRGKDRHEDPEYLARIIFCDLVEGSEKTLTGYGIGFSQHGDVNRVVTVDCSQRYVIFIDGTIKKFDEF